VRLLGGFQVERDGAPIPEADWRRRKAKALVKLLALAPGHSLSRDQVLEALWPDLPPDAGTNNLHKVLHLTRRVLEPGLRPGVPPTYLRFEEDRVYLGPASVDVRDFEEAASRADQTSQAADIEAALSLYRGDLLPEDLYEDWAAGAREGLQRTAVRLLLTRAERQVLRGDLAAAADTLHRVLSMDPVHEEAHRELILVYARQGSRHQAIRQYQRCRELLQAELGVEPSPETMGVYEKVLANKIAIARPTGEGVVPRLVGRDTELDFLEEQLDGATTRGRTVFIGGEAGVGKTRLTQAFLQVAAHRGTQVMAGGCYEREGQMPYLPFVEAFRAYLVRQAEEVRHGLLAGRAELGMLVTDTTAAPTVPQITSVEAAQDLKRRLFESVFDLLRDVCATSPCVLLLEDVHAADEATYQLLHYLARRAGDLPLLIVATYRDDELSSEHPLSAMLAELLLQQRATRLLLNRLGESDLPGLLLDLLGGHPVAPAVVRSLYEVTEGNPLFVQETVRTMQQEGSLVLMDGRWRQREGARPAASRELRSLLTRRLSRLGEGVRSALSAASVAGRSFSFRLLQGITGENEIRLLDNLDAAITASILEETEHGYRFRHALLRESLYDGISRHRRAYMHRVAAANLERDPLAPPEILAHHWYHSDQPERAVEPLVRAGNRARAVYANDQAIEYFRRAIDILEASTDPDRARLAKLYQRLGGLHHIQADTPAARQAYDRAVAFSGDPVQRARMQRLAAAVCITAGENEYAQAYLQAALSDLEERPDPAEAARVHYHLAQIAWHREDFDQAYALAQRSLELAEGAGKKELIAQSYEMLALVCHSLGEWQRGMSYVARRSELVGGSLDVAGAFDVHL
jgi:DNA-binding SARP family transcriptional activator